MNRLNKVSSTMMVCSYYKTANITCHIANEDEAVLVVAVRVYDALHASLHGVWTN
jgi:hypothetical protein